MNVTMQIVLAMIGSGLFTGVLTYFATIKKAGLDADVANKASWRADFESIVETLKEDNTQLRMRIHELATEVTNLQLQRMKLTDEVEHLKNLIVRIQAGQDV